MIGPSGGSMRLLEQAGAEGRIAARMERLPTTRWQVRIRVIIGTATFFDAFDSIAIASALPALATLWSLTPAQIGWLIGIGFIGQAIGALAVGSIAERWGRVTAATLSIGLFASMSLVCALAGGYQALLIGRFLQGIGLGGEVPVAATYINEIAPSRGRGRFFLIYECVFLFGALLSSLAGAYIVPRFGYRWMFVIGVVPAVLVLVLRRWCPESPRWLASRGRLAEADRVLSRIETAVARYAPLPPVAAGLVVALPHARTNWREILAGIYLRRSLVVWVLWFCSYLFTYGLLTWLPTIYRTVYKVPVQQSLVYGTLITLSGLLGGLVCAVLIDRVGRRIWMGVAFLTASVPVLLLALIDSAGLTTVITLVGLSSAAITTVTIVLYLYTPEVYPTRMRALGTSVATFWPRFSSFAGATLIGVILPAYGVRSVFLLFACVAALGGVVCLLGATETRNKVLEEISP